MDKIDFVLPWVDGQDRQWQAEKRRYEGKESAAEGDANDDCRYRDFGLLRYWFRSIEKFTPWVDNNIYEWFGVTAKTFETLLPEKSSLEKITTKTRMSC